MLPLHFLLLVMKNECDFGGQALSPYHWYLERGYPVSLQLWSTQDGGQHCKFFCPPIKHLLPEAVQTSAACPKSYADAMRYVDVKKSVDSKKSADARRYAYAKRRVDAKVSFDAKRLA